VTAIIDRQTDITKKPLWLQSTGRHLDASPPEAGPRGLLPRGQCEV
jgi:hypothetical protein